MNSTLHDRTVVVLASLLVAVVVSGCPSPTLVDAGRVDAGPLIDVDAGPTELSAGGYCEHIAPFFCDFYRRCGRTTAADQASCLALFAESCEGRYEPRYRGLVDAGLLTLSASGVALCEAHLETVSCDAQIRDLDGDCGAMWIGTVPTGGDCGFDVESFVCEPSATCVLSLDLCGTCRAAADLGSACGGDGPVCRGGAECFNGSCAARLLPGDACFDDGPRCVLGATCTGGVCIGPSFVEVGEACDNGRRCPYHATCSAGTCTLESSIGETCAASGPACDSGWCDANVCALLKLPMASCVEHAECATGRCVSGECDGMPSSCIAPSE